MAVNLSGIQALQCSPLGALLRTQMQGPTEVVFYSIDYSGWLASGLTVASVSLALSPVTTPPLVEGNQSIAGGTLLLFQLSGGVSQTTYTVVTTANISDGSTKVDTFLLNVGSVTDSSVGSSIAAAAQNFGQIAVGCLLDAARLFKVCALDPLFTAVYPAQGGSGDVNLYVNKATTANIASTTYQDNLSSRARVGLVNDDNLHIQVSSTGAAFLDSINVNLNTGIVSFPQGINISLIAGAVTPYTSPANQWLTAVSAGGLYSSSQPNFTNIAGSVAATQMPALTGDVTTSAGFVATTITTNIVTYAKFQQVAAVTLVGNPTGVLANAQGITVGAAFAFVGSALQTVAMTGDVTTSANSFATTVAANAVTYAKFQQVAASSLVGNPTVSLANSQGITLGATLSFSGTSLQTVAHTGDVTTSANSFATTIAAGAVTGTKIATNTVANSNLSQMAAHTYKGNNTGSTANVLDLTATQLTAELNAVVGDAGSGGTKGLVPAPPAGSAATFATLYANGSFLSLASSQSSPANPTGTANTTGLMMGLAGSFTPTGTGRAHIVITGTSANTASTGGGVIQIRYGTGSAPANGAALTGTAVGSALQFISASAAAKLPFSAFAVITGLTPGTPIWIDVSLAATVGGTATVTGVYIAAVEF